MNRLGYIRVASCCPEVSIGNPDKNAETIISLLYNLNKEYVRLAVFPELCITGYTCADLFNQDVLLDAADHALKKIASATSDIDIIAIVGIPVRADNSLYNCGAVISRGKICGLIPKSYIPNYREFYERRWFASGRKITSPVKSESGLVISAPGTLFKAFGIKFGIELCEDLWVASPVSEEMSLRGAELIMNLSATDEVTGKHEYLVNLIKGQSARCRCGYIYASAGWGESSTDMAFSGNCIIAEDGRILAKSERFITGTKYEIADIDISALRHDRRSTGTFSDNEHISGTDINNIINIDTKEAKVLPDDELLKYRDINFAPFLDSNLERRRERCREISSIQAWGLATRLKAIHCDKAIIGISGGLDSTLALLVTVKAFDMLGLDRKGIIGVTMPGFGTTPRTRSNAEKLMELLGITTLKINISEAVKLHFSDIGHDEEVHDITYENSQARERTQILMDLSNQYNGIVIGTGDLSELALGWCTYNGDQMSMYGVNASVPKTLVRYLVEGYAEEYYKDKVLHDVLLDICDTPISPELLPANSDNTIKQKTEDTVGPYELHDFFLYHLLRFGEKPSKIFRSAIKAFDGKYNPAIIYKWLRTFLSRFFSQQFKRSCMPDGVKVGSVCLSPRGDWRMPSDISSEEWRKDLEQEWNRLNA